MHAEAARAEDTDWPQIEALYGVLETVTGNAVVTLNPYTGGHGPQIVARATTADSAQALRSLDAIAATGATIVLTGHGQPWRRGAAAIADEARRAGIS